MAYKGSINLYHDWLFLLISINDFAGVFQCPTFRVWLKARDTMDTKFNATGWSPTEISAVIANAVC